MDGKVEVLTVQAAERFFFTVNAGLNDVPLKNYGVSNPILRSAKVHNPGGGNEGFKTFQAGDGVRILSIGLRLPYGFQLSVVPAWFQIVAKIPTTDINVGAFGNDGQGWIPGEQYELITDVSFSGGNQPYYLKMFLGAPDIVDDTGIQGLRVSMLNIPAGVIGDLPVVPFVKVQHNLDLIA